MPTQYWCALAHERFQPDDLLKQAEEAERAGFDGICCSDHLAPWWTDKTAPTSSGNAWVWLGAASRATSRAKLGPAVTAIVHRYNPVVVAQQIATLELLAPGRAFLGVGSGEAMNEVPAGMRWPSPEEQLERLLVRALGRAGPRVGAGVEGHARRRALHRRRPQARADLPQRGRRGARRDVHEAGDRVRRPRPSREAGQGAREARRDRRRAHERLG